MYMVDEHTESGWRGYKFHDEHTARWYTRHLFKSPECDGALLRDGKDRILLELKKEATEA